MDQSGQSKRLKRDDPGTLKKSGKRITLIMLSNGLR